MNSHRLLLASTFLVSLVAHAHGQTQWTGAVSGDWHTAANWSPAVVPGASDDVTIPLGAPIEPVVSSADAAVASLDVVAGAGLSIADGRTLDVGADLNLAGRLQAAPGSGLAVTGDVDVASTAQFLAPTGSPAGLATIELRGDGELASSSPLAIPGLAILGGSRVLSFGRAASLDLVQGAGLPPVELILSDGADFVVDGQATFAAPIGSATAGTATRLLTIEGGVTWSVPEGLAPSEVHPALRLRCEGDWTASTAAALAAGEVELSTDGAATISALPGTVGPASFRNLHVQSGSWAVVATDLRVLGGFLHNASLDLGGAELEVVGDFDSVDDQSAGIGAFAGGGLIRLTGDGSIRTPSFPGVPALRLEAGLRQVDGSTATQSLHVVGGVWGSRPGFSAAQTTVVGDLVLEGGHIELGQGAASATIEVEGDLVQTGTTITSRNPQNSIVARGDWTSQADFVLDEGWVEIFGEQKILAGSSPTFERLRFYVGSRALLSDVTVRRGLELYSATVDGDGWIELDGDFDPVQTTQGKFEHLRVVGGTVRFDDTRTTFLEQTGGTIEVLDGARLRVDRDATLHAGTYRSAALGSAPRGLDVGRDLIVHGTGFGTQNPAHFLRVGREFGANAGFSPTAGTLEFASGYVGELTVTAPGPEPSLPTVLVKSGVLRIESDYLLDANGVDVLFGGRLAVDAGARLSAAGVPFSVDGELAVGAGAELALDGASSIAVGALGRLELLGAPGNRAALVGHAGGGYSAVVHGTLAARDFLVGDVGPAGLELKGGYAPAPADMRSGEFTRPDPSPGSTLLNLGHALAEAAYGLTFSDPDGVGTYNVRRIDGQPVTLYGAGGSFAGESADDDPQGLVDWLALPTTTQLASFDAKNGPERVTVTWESEFEVATDRYLLESAPGPSGPFATVAELPATGPSAYAFDHTPLAPTVAVHYRLSEVATDGTVHPLGTADALPYPASPPANVLTVGPSGTFPDIQAAIDAATAQATVILVEPGTYLGFQVIDPAVRSLTILGDGPGVKVEDYTQALRIDGVPAGADLVLAGLAIVGNTSGEPMVELVDCAGFVSFSDCALDGLAGAGHAALSATSCASVALEDTSIDGGDPNLLAVGSRVYVIGGGTFSVDSLGGSQVRLCDATTQFVSTDGTSSLLLYPGSCPRLEVPALQPLGEPFEVTFTAQPGQWVQMAVAATALPLDPSSPSFWQMLLVVDATAAIPLGDYVADAIGQVVQPFELPPESALLGLRLLLQGWTIDLAPAVSVRFSGARALVAMP